MTAVPMALGALFGAGVLVATAGLRGVGHARIRSTRGSGGAERLLGASATGTVAAVVAFTLTGWVVGAVLAGVAAAMAPHLVGGRRTAQALTRRTEAVATWAEMLRDTLAGASGIEAAIVHTADIAPAEIRPATLRLSQRLAHEPLVRALHAFADDVADPTADLVVAALSLAIERQARDLGSLLTAVASAARAEATMVLRIEAGRARLQTAVRVVTGFTLGFAVLMVVFNRPYLEPFDDALGQLVLLVIGGSFAAGFWQLDRMARIAPAARLLARRGVTGTAGRGSR